MLPVRSESHAFAVLHILPQRKTELHSGFTSKSSQILAIGILGSKKGAWSGTLAFSATGAMNDIMGAASTHSPVAVTESRMQQLTKQTCSKELSRKPSKSHGTAGNPASFDTFSNDVHEIELTD